MIARTSILSGLLLFAWWLFPLFRGSQPAREPIVRIAEIEIDPHQVDAYKAALREEIEASIRTEPGMLTLYAVSVKDQPEQVRLFEIYPDAASYQAHLGSAHFQSYKQQSRSMVHSLTLLETEPILLGSKAR